MYLSFYRPPYHDEMLYGWIAMLAAANFPLDNTGIQRTADILFRYSKLPERRGVITTDGIRKDFIRGLDKSIRELTRKGFKIPPTSDILTFNTPLITESICRSRGTTARYIHTAVSEMTGTVYDMPKVPDRTGKIRVCPKCMAESRYIRMWHNLQGVTCCAEHKINLLSIPERTPLQHLLTSRWKDEVTEQASPEEIRYASLVKDIYDNPSEINIDILRSLLPSEDFLPGERQILSRHSASLLSVVNILSRFCADYSTLLTALPASVCPQMVAGHYDIVSMAKAGIVTVRCPSCGNVWTDHVEAVKAMGCPACLLKRDTNEWVETVLSGLGDGQYRMLDKEFQGMGSVPRILHETCGKARKIRFSSILWDQTVCQCEKAHSIESLKQTISLEGFSIVSYEPGEEIITLKHMQCGRDSVLRLQDVKSSKCFTCRYCRDEDRLEKELFSVSQMLGPEYEILGKSNEKIKILHMPCGTTFHSSSYSILQNRKRCPLCTPYHLSKREGTTPESKLFIEMKKWFDQGHKIWVSREHLGILPSKQYNDATLLLLKKGHIRRLSYGIYSIFDDVTVYDILKEKYLINTDGSPAGRFTGEAFAYMNGTGDDPEIITIESTTIARKSKSALTICGRRVIVTGI